MRSPHLHDTLRRFCLGAFAVFTRDLEDGVDLPFAFEEHGTLRPPDALRVPPARARLRRGARGAAVRARRRPGRRLGSAARAGCADLRPRARGRRPDERRAVYRSVLVPLLVRTAEGCGGFDWDDSAFARAYEELETSLYGEGHSYGAVAPLVGLSVGTQIELGDGIRVRAAATGELAAMWPEAAGLLPRHFGREPDRICVLELERSLPSGAAEAPDAPGELADAVTAIRLSTAAPVAAGPVLFERLDWRPYGIRPVLPIAATAPPGEPTRLDPFRASVASDLRVRLAAADEDAQPRRRPRPLGARALPVGAVPRRAAAPRARGRARRAATARGPPPCAALRCSVRRRRSAPSSPRSCGSRAASSCAASSSRCSCTTTGGRSFASSTRRSSAPRARSRISSNARASRHRHVTSCRLPSRHGGGARSAGPAGADRGARA